MNDYPIWPQEYFAPEVKLGVLDKIIIKLQNWRNRNNPNPLTYADVYKAISKLPR
jgi:hypothetical protein